MKLIIISGKSGAGKSVALRAMEDMNFYCIDNLPIFMLPQLSDILSNNNNLVAISIDIRNLPENSAVLDSALSKLNSNIEIINIFLEAEDRILIQRYSDSRRIHPLTNDGLSLEKAIELEDKLLASLRHDANYIIDTSDISNHQLAEQIRDIILGSSEKELHIVFESFGFKYGLPPDADFVFDVRFLPNPHWKPELRPMTGLDQPVIEYLAQHSEVSDFIQTTAEFIDKWLPMLEKNNRSYLTIAIGCTGGKHRSVYVTEQLAKYFTQKGKKINIYHRSLEHNKKK